MTATTPLELKLYEALRQIAKDYMTPDQLRRRSENECGLSYAVALEYSYENIALCSLIQSALGIVVVLTGAGFVGALVLSCYAYFCGHCDGKEGY